MNDADRAGDEPLPPTLAERVDAACDQFEAAWKAGERPRIEDHLEEAVESERPALLGELLALELAYRRRGGESPSPEEYRARFPDQAVRIDRVFAEQPAKPGRRIGTARPAVDASLAQVGTLPAEQGPDAPTLTYAVGPAAGDGRRFRILRLHDRGGLGEVFVARDEELRRDVALKQIQDRFADDEHSRARFLVEAEITGGLEHPGIVPVYGLGRHDDGRPYYAMRFIKGENLKHAADHFHEADAPGRDPGERALELQKLLRRFLAVCDAVAYAHSRGVVHRDLKPGNVMLGPFGETLVVDWGLAKVVGLPANAVGGEATLSLEGALTSGRRRRDRGLARRPT